MKQLPYGDPHRPVSERVEDLLNRMTLEEKAGLLFHTMTAIGSDGALDKEWQLLGFNISSVEKLVAEKHMNHFNVIDSASPADMAQWHNRLQERVSDTRLGIPVTLSSDPRHEFTQNNPLMSLRSEAFSEWPQPPGLAATRDEALVRQFSDIVRQEYLAVGIRVALHPQVDLATEPRWVRVKGTFGEDVELTCRLAKAYIHGIQGASLGPSSVAAMVKHFPGGGPQRDGHDPHIAFGKEQVYPGGNFDYHLEPFIAAIDAGCSQIMPYYGVPIGASYKEVGFGFNKEIVTDLLRDRLNFEGIVCTDWGLLTDWIVDGSLFPARAWGLEHLSSSERLAAALNAGVDQFGGEECPELLVELVRSRRISESRIDTSARRLLREKFILGLFDNRFVDVSSAETIVGRSEFRTAGVNAQRASLTILKNRGLPLSRTSRIYTQGIDIETARRYGNVTDNPDSADYAIIRLQAPGANSAGKSIEEECRAETLEFTVNQRKQIADLAAKVPTIVDIHLDRPAVLAGIADTCHGLIANYGARDSVLLDVVFGKSECRGRLPFDLASSVSAIEESRTDVAFDTKDPLFRFGHGLTL